MRSAFPIAREAAEQRMLAQWLDLKGLLWCHVPNGGARSIVTGAQLKREGVKPGAPDNLIFTAPPNKPGARGVAIELKRDKRARATDTQRWWLEALATVGWVTCVAHGADDAIRFLTELGY